jgi:hypothetical protein
MKEFLTPIQAIRKKCLECSNGQPNEIKECLIKNCPLYDYRISERHYKRDDGSEQISFDYLNIEYNSSH